MTATEIKTGIQKIIERLPEEALPVILEHLKGIQPQSTDQTSP
jgi:2-phosphoglycerate kinase